jgi:peptidoglycan/LPS O-acetylase OafA/YrhL
VVTFLPRIQVLRFVAASMVLFGHLQHKVLEVNGLDLGHFEPIRNATFFAGGVDIFFVLSGFIMYTISMNEFGRSGAPTQFFMRRLARIVPSYWLFTSAMVASMFLFSQHVAHNQLSVEQALASYLFIPTRNAYGDMYPALILGWTLNFEMFFYVIFAATLRFPRGRGLAMIFLAIGAVGTVGLIAPPTQAPMAFWCNPIVFEFLFGIALAHLHASGFRWGRAVGMGVGALAVTLLYFGAQQSEPSPFWPARFVFMGLPALGVCAAAALMREAASEGRVQRLLVLAGDASFALYLSHPFSLVALVLIWPHIGSTSPWLFVAGAFLTCVAVSIAFHLGLEKPVTDSLNRWIKGSRLGARQAVGT